MVSKTSLTDDMRTLNIG